MQENGPKKHLRNWIYRLPNIKHVNSRINDWPLEISSSPIWAELALHFIGAAPSPSQTLLLLHFLDQQNLWSAPAYSRRQRKFMQRMFWTGEDKDQDVWYWNSDYKSIIILLLLPWPDSSLILANSYRAIYWPSVVFCFPINSHRRLLCSLLSGCWTHLTFMHYSPRSNVWP